MKQYSSFTFDKLSYFYKKLLGTFAQKSHTHNYAGSLSSGGAATSANKLNSNAGSSTQPVFFQNGIPVATAYTLGKSVPADAKFTDTNTTYENMTAATSSAAGKSGLVPAPAAGKQGSFLRGDGTWATPTDTTYSAATTTSPGLMSANDKSKLDRVADGATKVSVDSALSASSTNPVQNKVINAALSEKAARKTFTATLGTTWSGTGPYKQTVTVSGILATDTPHIAPSFSGVASTAASQKEAWNCVGMAVSAANSITFTCFDDKPTVSIPLLIEVIR